MSDDEQQPVTITLPREHLAAIVENAEWSLRFAELYEEGDALEDVPLWPTIDRLYREHRLERLPVDCRPKPDEWRRS